MLDGSREEPKEGPGCTTGLYGETLQTDGRIGRRKLPCGVLYTLREMDDELHGNPLWVAQKHELHFPALQNRLDSKDQ
jgi:hypothetical protein